MTDLDILRSALEKTYPHRVDELWEHIYPINPTGVHYYKVIFNHDFAKALWGEDIYEGFDGVIWEGFEPPRQAKNWEYHLQQMVIYEVNGVEAPLEYLERFLGGNE
jgi:hypothetical protein